MPYVWIILIYLYVALLIPIFCRFEKHKKSTFIIIALLYVAYEVDYFLGIGVDNYLLDCSFFYIIPYGLTAFMGVNYTGFSDRMKKKIIFSSFLIFVVVLIAYWINTGSIQDIQIAKYPPRLYYLSYGLGVSYLLMFICEHHYSRVYDNKFIRFISAHSLGIYLCHVMVLEFYKLLGLPHNWLLKFGVVFFMSAVMV